MTNTPWRLLLDTPADGATNMARDEALARCVANTQLPTLRLYAWQPACLSLGRFQRASDVRLDAAAHAGFDVVRRPSGGRAILHAHEITYAIVAPDTLPLLAGGVRATYCAISRALLAGLRLLGVEAELAPPKRRTQNAEARAAAQCNLNDHNSALSTQHSALSTQHSVLSSALGVRPAACFDSASDYEVIALGRKLVGSAQVRSAGAIIQHGSLPLADPTALLRPLLSDAPADLGAHSIALDEAAGRDVSWGEAARAIIAGLEQTWGIDLRVGALTAVEHQAEAELRAKYADWSNVSVGRRSADQGEGVGEPGSPTPSKEVGVSV